MNYSEINFNKIITLVKKAAHEILIPLSDQIVSNKESEQKQDGSIVTVADQQMQDHIRDKLERLYPDVIFLGEEMSEQEQKQVLSATDAYIWCLDPLDGTTNYSTGLPYWCVSLALMNADGVVFGMVYDPERNECFSAIKGQGALLNGQSLQCSATALQIDKAVANIDFKRLDIPLREKLVKQPRYRSQRNMGACALEWCWLTLGRFDLYLHGGMKHWDYAAGSLIHAEAGGYASTLQGEEVFDTHRDKQSVVAATSKQLFEQWLEYVGNSIRK